jgi:hypothetical protein
MSKTDDDETTSARANVPRAPVLPARGRTDTRRGVDPNLVKTTPFAGRPRGDAGGDLIDDGPTTYDPEVPTGQLDRVDENRPTARRAATGAPLIDDDDLIPVPTTTVIGKRNAKSGPRNAPAPPEPLPPTEESKPRRFDPHARIDDSTRTNRWEADEIAPPATAHVRAPASPAQGLPLQPGPISEPIRVVSMKTPADVDADKPTKRPLPEVRLRAIADVHKTPPHGMGRLAPPRDPKEARSRRVRDNVIWGSVAVIVAAVVMLAVWFLAR